MVRILFQNPQGLGPLRDGEYSQSPKINKLKDTLLTHNVDILGLSEVNKDWRIIPQKQSLWQLTDRWFEYRRLTTSINNLVPSTSQQQFGGTALMAINKLAYSISAVENDSRKLGRWTSILLKGKNQRLCRIICAYCPCIGTGPSSTYAQQVIGLAKQHISECPRKQFWWDLQRFIEQCQLKQEQLIIMGDWNSDYNHLTTWMMQFGLHDVITSRHGAHNPPPTCKRSTSGPIDAIFVPTEILCWRGGYLSFDYLEGDHRGLWCDLPVEYLLGYNMQHPAHPKARRLKTTDPRICKKYISLLHKDFSQQKLYEKAEQLFQSTKQNILPTDLIQFEELDSLITQAMESAEKKCRKLKTGIVKWSPLYQRACDRVTYWKLMQRSIQGVKVNIRKIRSLRKKLGISQDILSAAAVDEKLGIAIKERNKCKRYAPELQMEYRHRLALAKAAEDNIPAATHIKNLTQQENMRILFRRIRYLERKTANLSTSRVTVTTSSGRQKDVIQKELIERHIIGANEKKYHQTEGHSQLQRGQLCQDIGLLGEGKKVKSILNGTYHPPHGTNRHTKQFLRMMKRPDTIRKIQQVSIHEFYEGWKKAKEKTSSNGPHFGHYKAILNHPKLAHLFYQRSLFPMVTGYSPDRHRQGIDVMLLKKENSYEVDRLRTIVLFDSEANMNYKHLGRRAMNAAIKNNQIATEQYSRPQRKAIDHAINRRLVMDHQLYCRQPYALVSCDLKSCYDRITHSSASLVLQRIGVPQSEAVAMFDSIQRMTHRVRTAFGTSAITYGGTNIGKRWKLPPQGVLQGNGCGPAIWSLLSSLIFMIMRDQGHRTKIKSSIHQYALDLSGFAYVDDTDLLHTDNVLDRVVQRIQMKVNDWNDLVGVTGGILSPEKCWWYLVTFRYSSGKWIACNPQHNFQLWIKDESKKKHQITQMSTSHGANMLGVLMAPDGNNKDHVRALRDKADKWARNMSETKANKEEVWTALHRTIPFSICYSLPAMTLSKKDCIHIMAPVNKVGLSLAGISSTIPTPVRVGPKNLGGLGVLDPYLHMGVSKIESFITHTWLKTPTGILMDIALDDIIMEIGIAPPYSITRIQSGLRYAITHTWIRHMLVFATEQGIELNLNTIPFLPKRQRDMTIMDLAIATIPQGPQLQSINRVRMQLNVIWKSDITTADGRKIDTRYTQNGQHTPKRNNYTWPLQHHVTAQDWRTWRQWLRRLCTNDTGTWEEPLGLWTCGREDWTTTWDCFIDQTKECLYIRTLDGLQWHRHLIQRGRERRRNCYYLESLLHNAIPDDPRTLRRVSVIPHQRRIEVVAISELPYFTNNAIDSPPWLNVQPHRASILSAIQDTCRPIFLDATNSIDQLVHDFSNGSIIAVSDGSHFPTEDKAACAWILESACGSQWIMGAMTIPGPPESFNSYRSELMGLLCVTISIKVLASGCAEPRHVIIGCDGKAALQTLGLSRHDCTANTENIDIVSSMVDIWATLKAKPLPVHIKGHQDDTQQALTRLERMNILMDKLAKLAAMASNTKVPLLSIPTLGIRTVSHRNYEIVGDVGRRLYKRLVTDQLLTYFCTQLSDTALPVDDISLKSLEHARHNAPPSLQIFHSKWISNTVATGVVLQKRNHRIFNRCPRCNTWGEDRLHVVVCWDQRATMIWNRQMERLKQFFLAEDTDPDITNFLLTSLTSFRKSPTQRRQQHLISPWQRDIHDVGMFHLLSGFIPNSLVQAQETYYKAMGTRKTGHVWAGRMIYQFWILIHQMWLGRNNVLHQKNIINKMSGESLLDIEIEREYDQGCATLPVVAHKWFHQTKEELMNKSLDYKKGWLLIIRTIKETLEIAEYSIFTSSRALRKWIGLSDNNNVQRPE